MGEPVKKIERELIELKSDHTNISHVAFKHLNTRSGSRTLNNGNLRSQRTVRNPRFIQDLGPVCSCCQNLLQEPYVECSDDECEATICTSCYSTGKQTTVHKSDHAYRIRKNDFPIFDSCNWTAKEEIKLLNGLSTHGYGNWEEIAKNVQTRSDMECEEHYKKYYVDCVQYEELKLLPHTTQSMFPQPLIPFLESEKPRNDNFRDENFCNRNLAGYNPFRSDFSFNYDNNAEKMLDIVKEIDYEDDLMVELSIAIGNALNTRLRERKRRYDIIKRHGLILYNKMSAWVQRYYETLGRSYTERMFPFMQFFTGMQFDALMEQLNLEEELSQKLGKLYEYRRLGIRTLHGTRVYKKLKKSEDIRKKEIRTITALIDKGFEPQSVQANDKLVTNILKNRSAPKPLEIEDLPGYHSLSNTEKDLCSNLRLLPQKYLEIRDQLIMENAKLGFLRLLDARKIVRIDVNKTRKVYDYLVKEGFIKKPC